MAGSGADTLAGAILGTLTTGITFTTPTVNLNDANYAQPTASGALYGTIDQIDIAHLTTGVVGGTGVFDKILASLVAHLKVEYTENRISGAEYTKAYMAMVAEALAASNQFILGKDQAYWSALLVQAQAKAANIAATTARVELETAKAGLVRAEYEAENAKVTYGLTKIQIAVQDVTYSNLTKQGSGIDFTNTNILPKQATLLAEQGEAQRAQTMNTRSDGVTTVTGAIGKQKELYTQQIDSYKRDAETKVAKIFSDAWITQKTIDEGLTPPTEFNNTNVNEVLEKIRQANGLD